MAQTNYSQLHESLYLPLPLARSYARSLSLTLSLSHWELLLAHAYIRTSTGLSRINGTQHSIRGESIETSGEILRRSFFLNSMTTNSLRLSMWTLTQNLSYCRCVKHNLRVRARAGVYHIGNNHTRYEHAQYTKEHTTCIFVKCWVTTEWGAGRLQPKSEWHKSKLTHVTQQAQKLYGSLFHSGELAEFREEFLAQGVWVCVRALVNQYDSCCTICYLVFWPDSDSFSNAEDQDSHTISLSQLEVILIKMRFMEEDAVYQAKRVLVLIDVIEILFVLQGK